MVGASAATGTAGGGGGSCPLKRHTAEAMRWGAASKQRAAQGAPAGPAPGARHQGRAPPPAGLGAGAAVGGASPTPRVRSEELPTGRRRIHFARALPTTPPPAWKVSGRTRTAYPTTTPPRPADAYSSCHASSRASQTGPLFVPQMVPSPRVMKSNTTSGFRA